MKIAMLVLNNLEYDSRVKKEAASLIQAGHDLLVFSAQKKAKNGAERIALQFNGVDIPVQPMEIPFSMLERAFAGIALGSKKVLPLFLWPFGVFSHQQYQSEKGKHPLLVSLAKAPVYALRSVLRFLVKTFNIFLPPSWVLRGWRSAVVQWSPDVVHCHDLETCSVGLEVLDQIDCGLVYDSHELWTERTRREVPLIGYLVKRAERAMESKVLEVCGGAITVSPEIADHLASRYTVRREKIAVVRNAPILAAHSTAAGEGSDLELEIGLGTGSIIYSGRISPKRALEDLLHAVSASGRDKHYGQLDWEDSFSVEEMYSIEWATWRNAQEKEASKLLSLFLQFDIDSEPERGNSLIRLLERFPLRASVMIFNKRINRQHLRERGKVTFTDYETDTTLLNSLQASGQISIGYHTNAMEQALWSPQKALEIFERDIESLRRVYQSIEIFSPHGGVPGPLGENNHDIPVTSSVQEKLKVRWVHNRRAPTFNAAFSDGGFSNPNREAGRLNFPGFVGARVQGQRARVLIHPQYLSLPNGDVNLDTVPLHVLSEPWYQHILGYYRPEELGWALAKRLDLSMGMKELSSPWAGFKEPPPPYGHSISGLMARVMARFHRSLKN